MKLIILGLSLAATLGVNAGAAPARVDQKYATVPRAAWADADPADSLYRLAKRLLNQKDYEAAARTFDAIVAKFPKSEYAPDALYWKGFALYRNGDNDAAVEALESQAKRYPNAPTRGDASALLITVKSQLARQGDAEAKRDVDRAAQQAGTSCTDIDVQSAALQAVQQMDGERVMPLLKRVLARRDACSLPLRKDALFILSQKSGADREKILLDVAKTDPSPDVRKDAVFHLQQARSDLAVDALEDLLMHSDDRGVRSNALFSLAQNKSDRTRKILRTFALLDDAPAALRKDAIFYLAQSKDPADVAWLKEAYTKTTDPDQRKDIMFHIGQRNTPESSKWLSSVARDPKEPFAQRKDALFYLGQRKADGLNDLIAVYDDATPEIRKEILFYIGQRHEAAALDKLIEIAKKDPSPQVRKDALFYISQSKDPKAIKALEEIIAP